MEGRKSLKLYHLRSFITGSSSYSIQYYFDQEMKLD